MTKIGVALAAGGSVGVAYHGGVLAAVAEATGWDAGKADVLLGTSAGSVTSAMLRAGVPAVDLARISEGRPLSAQGSRVIGLGRPRRPKLAARHALGFRPMSDPRGVLRGVTRPWSLNPRALALAAMPSGFIPTNSLSDGLDALFPDGWPESALWICSYDQKAGKRVVFGRPEAPEATVGAAVAASSAIPSHFAPVEIRGRRYVDGGVSSMVNLDVLAGAGLDVVVVVSPLTQASPWPSLNATTVVRQVLGLQLRREVAALRSAGVEVAVIQPGRRSAAAMGINPMDAARRGDVSRAARAEVESWLAGAGRRFRGLLADQGHFLGGAKAV